MKGRRGAARTCHVIGLRKESTAYAPDVSQVASSSPSPQSRPGGPGEVAHTRSFASLQAVVSYSVPEQVVHQEHPEVTTPLE